jgi:hypothetical protein
MKTFTGTFCFWSFSKLPLTATCNFYLNNLKARCDGSHLLSQLLGRRSEANLGKKFMRPPSRLMAR